MHLRLVLHLSVSALLFSFSSAAMRGQERNQQPTDACPSQPHTLAAMRNCYRPLLVFAPALDDPQLMVEFNQLKTQAIELKRRSVMYVPIVPEGHNQPIPPSKVPTARLSEDELAAVRHRFKVEPADFLVILIGKDGRESLSSRTPVGVDQVERLVDSMPKRDTKQQPQGEP
jgi:Domain of unknown function (DUF4174)